MDRYACGQRRENRIFWCGQRAIALYQRRYLTYKCTARSHNGHWIEFSMHVLYRRRRKSKASSVVSSATETATSKKWNFIIIFGRCCSTTADDFPAFLFACCKLAALFHTLRLFGRRQRWAKKIYQRMGNSKLFRMLNVFRRFWSLIRTTPIFHDNKVNIS